MNKEIKYNLGIFLIFVSLFLITSGLLRVYNSIKHKWLGNDIESINVLYNKGEYGKALDKTQLLLNRDKNNLTLKLWLGKLYTLNGNITNALKVYKEIQTDKKDDPFITGQIVDIQLRLGKISDSQKTLNDFLKQNPKNKQLSDLLARLYLKSNEYNSSIEIYKKLIKYYPDEYIFYYKIGAIYESINDQNSSIQYYKLSLNKNNKCIKCLDGIGRIYLRKNLFDTALESYKNILLIDSKNLEALIAIGSIYQKMDSLSQSLPYYQKIINLLSAEKNEKSLNQNDKTILALALDGISNYYIKTGDENQAWKTIAKSIEINPDVRETYLIAIPLAIKKKQFSQADNFISRILHHYENNHLIWYWRGKVYKELGNSEEAIKSFNRSLSIQPEQLFSNLELSTIYLLKGNYEESYLILSKLKTFFPDDYYVQLYNAICKIFLQKEIKAGEKIIHSLEKQFPQKADSFYWDAELVLRFNNATENALKLAEKAVQIEPTNIASLEVLARIELKMGKNDNALIHLNKAINLSTSKSQKEYLKSLLKR